MNSESPVACNLEAFSEQESQRYEQLFAQIKKSMLMLEESENGYRLHLPYTPKAWMDVAKWITLENMCCPFFRFAQQFVTEDKVIILHISGPEGTKAILKEELRKGGCC